MNYRIRKASEEDREAIARLLADAFYYMMKAIHKNKDRLFNLLLTQLIPPRFWVAIDENCEVIGIAALCTAHEPPVLVDEGYEHAVFWGIRGYIVGKILTEAFMHPELADDEAYIECVAVRSDLRRHGIASALVETLLRKSKARRLYLNVIDGHEEILPLYEKEGFRILERRKEKLAFFKGYKFTTVMTAEKGQPRQLRPKPPEKVWRLMKKCPRKLGCVS